MNMKVHQIVAELGKLALVITVEVRHPLISAGASQTTEKLAGHGGSEH